MIELRNIVTENKGNISNIAHDLASIISKVQLSNKASTSKFAEVDKSIARIDRNIESFKKEQNKIHKEND